MEFRIWFESKFFTGIEPSDIEWWANYAKTKVFKTPEEARQWIFDRKEHNDRQPHAYLFGGINGSDFNKAFANAMPLYQSGKSWKIGKRIRKKPFSWSDVDIRRTTLESLTAGGYVNPFDGPELSPVQMIPILKLHKTESHADTAYGQSKVMWLVQQIKNGEGYFKAIVYGSNGEIIDGHHRYEAAKMLKMKTVPAQLLIIQE